MIFQDYDSMWTLDCFGEFFAEYAHGESTPDDEFQYRQKFINDACEFAESEYQKFFKQNDSKLAGRYYQLLQYLNDRRTKFWQ